MTGPAVGPVPWQAAWQANCPGDTGGSGAFFVAPLGQSGIAYTPVVVRAFRPSPVDPNRASGEGKTGSDPPVFAPSGARRGGVWGTHWGSQWGTPPSAFGGVAPGLYIPAGRLAGPRAGRTIRRDERRDA